MQLLCPIIACALEARSQGTLIAVTADMAAAQSALVSSQRPGRSLQ